MADETTAQQQEHNVKAQGVFGYVRSFVTGLLKDSKFWSRFNAVPNGGLFIAQGVIGALFLVSSAAPAGVVAAGLAGCAILAGIGLYGIGYGLPRAWQSMEALCKRTFPKLNPLRKARKPIQAFVAKIARTRAAQKILKSPLARIWPKLKTEAQQDIFLAALTLEGASAAAVGCTIAVAPHILALPAITVGGAAIIGWGAWTITACMFDIYNAGKTLAHSARAWWQERKDKKKDKKQPAAKLAPVAPAQKPAAEPAPSLQTRAAAPAFNEKADAVKKEDMPPQPQPPAAKQPHAPRP